MTDHPYAIGANWSPGLAKLAEEGAEMIEVIGKIIGNGGHMNHFDGTNLESRLCDEVGDLIAAIRYARAHNSALARGREQIERRAEAKFELFQMWDGAERTGDPLLYEAARDLLRGIKGMEDVPDPDEEEESAARIEAVLATQVPGWEPQDPSEPYRCAFEGCEHEAEELSAIAVEQLRYLHGSGDAGAVPLCHPHGEFFRTRSWSGCLPTCRFPFGSHAQGCPNRIPYSRG